MPCSVLHIDTETGWRGGQNQLRLLLQNAPAGWTWHVAVPPGSAAAARLAPLARVVTVPMRGAAQLTAAVTLARHVRTHGITIIDAHTSHAHGLALMVHALAPSVRVVVHRRVDLAPAAGLSRRLKYGSADIDRYVCISARIAAVLREAGIDPARLAVVRSAADPAVGTGLDRPAERARLLAAWGAAPDTVLILNVAALTPEKDHAMLVRALGRLHRDGRRFLCAVAGDGPGLSALQDQARALGLDQDRLRLLGRRDDVAALMAGADVFVLTSRQEGLGTSLLDAARAGCALVATDTGGIPEIVQDGRTGLLAPVGDDAALASALGNLVDDAGLRARLAEAAGGLVEAEFSAAAMAAGNCAVYEAVAAAGRP